MAFDDLFGNADVDPMGYAGPQNAVDASFNTGGAGAQFEDLFSDPNFIRGLGETGAAISSGQSGGKAIGDFASNITRRRAVQKGARESRNNQDSFQSRLLGMLSQGNLLSPKEQNDAFDNMTIDGDGNVSLSMKNTPQKAGFGKNQSLESVKASLQASSPGGVDLPDFSNQSGGKGFDFAGLDADDIGMLLKAEQQFGTLSDRQARTLLAEKTRRATLQTSNKRRAEDLKLIAAQRAESKRRFGITQKDRKEELRLNRAARVSELGTLHDNRLALVAEQDKLSRIPTDMQSEDQKLRAIALGSQIDVANKRIEKMDVEMDVLENGKPATTKETLLREKQEADLDRKATELGLKLDTREKDEIFSVQETQIDKDGMPIPVEFEEREANAQQANHRADNKVFYLVRQPVVTELFDGKSDQDGTVMPIFLPKHPATGKQITSQDVIDTAQKNGVSPNEVLRQWGLIQ